MAIRHSAKCITNGLVYCLDAANRKSYTGAGTNTINPVNTSISGTLINSPTWTNELGGGTFAFDGVNQYINLGSPTSLFLQVNWTCCGWFNHTSNGTSNTIYAIYDSFTQDHLVSIIRIDTGQFGCYASAPSGIYQVFSPSYFPSLNQWHYFAVTISGSLSTSTVTVYADTSSVGSTTFTSMSSNAVSTINRTIGGSLAAPEYFPGKIPLLWVYNRALTSDEVFQNYNTTKGRFGKT